MLAIKLGLAATLAFVSVAATADSPSVTDEASFATAIASIRADANNYDKFKAPVKTGLIGHSFKLTLPLIDDAEGSGAAIFDYQGGKLVLDISPSTAWPTLLGPKEAFPVILVNSTTKNLGSYVGQNAYGATARVTSFKDSVSGIAIVDMPKPMLSPSRERIGGDLLENTDWWISLDLSPADAKALAHNARAVIEGVYAGLPTGPEGFCQSEGASATIEEPTDYHAEKCFIGAKVTRIALINSATGGVLKEWTTANDPMLGPELWGGIRAGMNKYQLKAIQPTITDYGYFESDGHGVQVDLSKETVSKVEVRYGGAPGKALLNALIAKYGRPLSQECFVSLCKAKWNVNSDVSAYLGIDSTVTYELSQDKPPIGF